MRMEFGLDCIGCLTGMFRLMQLLLFKFDKVESPNFPFSVGDKYLMHFE